MANMRDLRRRRGSAGKTRRITRTMELVAGAKLKRVQREAESFRPYAEGLFALTHRLAYGDAWRHHELLRPRMPFNVLVLVASSDRGLCGPFNGNLATWAYQVIEEHQLMGRDVEVVSLGRRGASLLTNLAMPPQVEHEGLMEAPTFASSMEIFDPLLERYLSEEFDRIDIVYSRVGGSQGVSPDHITLLPANKVAEDPRWVAAEDEDLEFIYHPERQRLLDDLAPRTVRILFHSCLLQTAASEHMARRMAMQNATDAADELIHDLGIQYNRERQARITKEISEIVGAVEAMS